MPKKQAGIEGQSPLFAVQREGDYTDANLRTWEDIEKDDAARVQAVMSENVGAHVNVAERAERLIMAMNALAHRNMLQGFDVGAHDNRYKEPIWMRYLDVTPTVINLSQSKAERLHDEAEDHFRHAMGFEALRGTGLITVGEVKSRSEKMWRDFHDGREDSPGVGAPVNHKNLVKLRNTQKKFLPKDHPLRQKKPRQPKTAHEHAA